MNYDGLYKSSTKHWKYVLTIELKIIQLCSKKKTKMKKMLLHGKGFNFFLIAFSQTV